MRTALLVLAFITAAASGFAQQSAPDRTFSSAADVQALLAKAKADHKAGQPTVIEQILHLAPYNANLEYRTSVGPAAVHEKEAEIFYVIDGTATMVTGGKLTEEKRTNAENRNGAGITGGETRSVAKGDFIIVPEDTPHWFSQINGTLVLMTLHVPRPIPGK